MDVAGEEERERPAEDRRLSERKKHRRIEFNLDILDTKTAFYFQKLLFFNLLTST